MKAPCKYPRRLLASDQPVLIQRCAWIAAGIGLWIGVALLVGCASSVTGGSIKRDVRQGEERKAETGLRVTVAPDGAVEIVTDRKAVANTRPSESSETTGPSASGHGAMPKVGAVSEGKLGGVSFDEMAQTIRASWPLFLIFALVAAVSWKLGSIPVALLCAGLAIVAVIYPAGLLWLALAAVAAGLVAIYLKYRERIRELVMGGENVIKRFGDDAKVEMERAHSAGTKAAVRAAKGK